MENMIKLHSWQVERRSFVEGHFGAALTMVILFSEFKLCLQEHFWGIFQTLHRSLKGSATTQTSSFHSGAPQLPSYLPDSLKMKVHWTIQSLIITTKPRKAELGCKPEWVISVTRGLAQAIPREVSPCQSLKVTKGNGMPRWHNWITGRFLGAMWMDGTVALA